MVRGLRTIETTTTKRLSSRLCDIAAECQLKLLTKAQQNNDSHYFEHDSTVLLAMDRKQQAEIYAIESANGATSPDEYRAATNRNPRPDGEGDKFFQPNANYVPVETDADSDVPDETTDAMAILRDVISEQISDWKQSSISCIEKECKRKTAGKFSNWIENFEGIKIDDNLVTRADAAKIKFKPKSWIQELKSEISDQVTDVNNWQGLILDFLKDKKDV